MLSPGATYAALARTPSRLGPLGALRRPLLVAMIFGAFAAIGATRHAPPGLLLSTTICWSTVVIMQAAIALVVIAAPARRTVGIPRALDLFFASHAPWSFWMLAVAAWGPVPGARSMTPLLAAALIPMVLTPRAIAAFFREVLELDPRAAMRRTLAHQALTWTVCLVLFGSAVALLPRIVEWIG